MSSLRFISENSIIIAELVNKCKTEGVVQSKLLPNKAFIQATKEHINDYLGNRECIKVVCMKDNKQIACLYEEL